MNINFKKEAAILEIATKNNLVGETLETRRSDSLDFHDCAVWGIRQALIDAVELGRELALEERRCRELALVERK